MKFFMHNRRKARLMTQADMGAFLECSHDRVSKIERGGLVRFPTRSPSLPRRSMSPKRNSAARWNGRCRFPAPAHAS